MAYVNTFTIQISNATDALFRAWCLAIHNEILGTGSGWSVASDTGQMDFTTVLAPTIAGQIRGYRVYKMTGLPDIYLIIEFGMSASGTTPAMYVTVARSTNGTGTPSLGSMFTTRQEMRAGSNEAAVRTCKIFAYASGLAIVLQYDTAIPTNSLVIGVERIKDATGSDSNGSASPQGVIKALKVGNLGSIFVSQVIDFATGTDILRSGSTATNPFSVPAMVTGGTLFNNKASLIPFRFYIGEELPPLTIFQGHLLSDAAGTAVPTVVVYSVNMTYYCFGNVGIGAVNSAGIPSYWAIRQS